MSSILIIDDSPEDREQFSALLEGAEPGVSVVACHGGSDGMARLKEKHFDCVLLDLRLDGEDGLDVLGQMQALRPNIPVIVFSGQGSEKAATDAFVAGAAYYLPKKDLTTETLWTAVSRVIRQAEKDRELKSKREALERSNRLDAVGQLAAGIAHDFNNQLGALRFSIELLKDVAVTERSKEQVRTALKIIDESARLAARMVALSRQGGLMAKNVSLQDALADLRALAAASVSDQVMFEVSEPEAGLVAFCDPGQLLNALTNLVLNADDAITSKGGIGTVSVSARRDGETVRINVRDNGTGMSEDVLARCSDPFFTTKADRNGTGLGLAMVQSFVNDNDGTLLIRSDEGVGTDVMLVLPSGVGESTDAQVSSATRTKQRNAQVLLVEDQTILANLTMELLENEGFDVQVAYDGAAALEALSEGAVDLLLTDIRMPGMNGFELADEVKRQNPATRIVYWTGQADDADHKKQSLHGPVLQKPVEPDTLISSVRQALTDP